jgi:hypothetical protein
VVLPFLLDMTLCITLLLLLLLLLLLGAASLFR